MKKCFKCEKAKPLADFYKHKMMADGHLGKCKECAKRDVRKHRRETEGPREYDRKRYRENLKRREYTRKISDAWAAKYPEKCRAQWTVNNAVRDKRLIKMPCEKCGAVYHIHGHHDDYSKPLDVIWLCVRCHAIHHYAKAD